jgi:Protein of unknown function (DUF2804)
MPILRDGRPLKRWSYVGAYGPSLMACFGAVAIGGLPQAFWAVWDRERGELRERTRFGPGAVSIADGVVRVRDRGLRGELRIEGGTAVEVVSAHGRSYIWTRKRAPARVRGTLMLDDRAVEVDALGIVDESAGYHARETAWTWSAGVGALEDGRPVAWNLVDGVHDAAAGSERTVWVGDAPHEVGPVRFADDLTCVRFPVEGGGLACVAEAERARDDRIAFGLLHSVYRQPFGTFTGTLPGAGALAAGYGVMERHDVRW